MVGVVLHNSFYRRLIGVQSNPLWAFLGRGGVIDCKGVIKGRREAEKGVERGRGVPLILYNTTLYINQSTIYLLRVLCR